MDRKRQSPDVGPDAPSGWASAARQISAGEREVPGCAPQGGEGARSYVDRGASTLTFKFCTCRQALI